MSRRSAWLLLLLAALATAVVHGKSVTFDFSLNDYVLLRPWSQGEIGSVWHGSGGSHGCVPNPITAR